LLYCREDHDGIRPVPEHPIRLDLDDYLPYLVNRVGSIMALRFGEDVLAQFGLSIAMWRVLAALSSNGAQRHTDLAGLTSIEVSTLSRIVTRLVRAIQDQRPRNRGRAERSRPPLGRSFDTARPPL
jgi:hypothetical protein